MTTCPKLTITDHTHLVTHVDNPADHTYLRTPLHDVCMRLFTSNPHYRELVLRCCDYLERACLTKLEGYKLPHGMSAANLGLPWNLIAVAVDRDTPKAHAMILINPTILEYRGPIVRTWSNCGSIRLPEPIEIERYTTVVVGYNETDGSRYTSTFGPESGSFTIQHEVDHNRATLITDRAVKRAGLATVESA